MDKINWTAIGTISQAWEAFIVTITIIFLFFQIKDIKQESGMRIALAVDWLSDNFSSDKYKKRYRRFKNCDIKNPSDVTKNLGNLKYILGEYDKLLYLIQKKFLNKEIIFKFNSVQMLKIKNKIEKILDDPNHRDASLSMINERSGVYELICGGADYAEKYMEHIK